MVYMKNFKYILIFFLIQIYFCFGEVYHAKVVQVMEGDVIKVRKDKRTISIKLYGIDCPELKQSYGNTAKKYTSNLCLAKMVKVKVINKDKFGRTIAQIILDNGNILNTELVKHGYAWYQKGYSIDESIAKLEIEAKADYRGLWQDPEPVAPWKFKVKARTRVKKVELKGVFQEINQPIIVSIPINAKAIEFKHLAIKLTLMYGFVKGEFGNKADLMELLKKEQFLETAEKFIPFVEDQANKITLSYSYKELQLEEHRSGFTTRLMKKLNEILMSYGLKPRVNEILIKSFIFSD